MCGRFARHSTVNDFVRLIPGLTAETQASLNPRYNIAPSQALLLARNGDEGNREWAALYWGLLPFGAKDPKMRRPINARAETVHQKPFFRTAFNHRLSNFSRALPASESPGTAGRRADFEVGRAGSVGL